MRNLKRALSLVLAALMLIGMMVVGAGAAGGVDDFTDRDEIVNKDAVSMLTILGVINGKEDGSYYAPKDNVTRAEMAKMIATIMNQGADVNDLYANMDTGLTDISNNWAKGYINYCYSLGIIAGRGAGIFDPTAPVTGNEAAKMLLVAIGYDPAIEGLEGSAWAIKTTALASTLGIFDDLTVATSEYMNRDNAALLIYNALDVEMIQSYTENGYAIAYNDKRTLLSNKYGVYKVEGVVTANEWAQLEGTNSAASIQEGKTVLSNGTVYSSTTSNTTGNDTVYTTFAREIFKTSTPVDFLGKTVTMYIKKTTVLANSTVLGVTLKDDGNDVYTTAANVNNADGLYDDSNIILDASTEYYVNYGAYATQARAINEINKYSNVDLGNDKDGNKIVLNGIPAEVIDNDQDGVAEYVLYTLETLSLVRSYNTNQETISLYEDVLNNAGNPTGNAVAFTEDFEDVVFNDDVNVDDLVLYVQYGGRTYVKLAETVTGTMTRVDRDEAKELYITLDDGNEYRQSYIPETASKVDADIDHFNVFDARNLPGFDTEYEFVLDSNGYVAALRPAEAVVTNYGLVLESAWTQNALTKAGEVKILKTDGTEQKYSINWSASDDAFASVPGAAGTTAEERMEDYLGTRDVIDGRETGAAVGTVIAYSVSDDGVLTIEKVLSLHNDAAVLNEAGNVGYVTYTGANDEIGDGTENPAYAVANTSAPAVYGVNAAGNLQWALRGDYDQKDATIELTYNNEPVDYAVDRNTVAFYYAGDVDGNGKVDSDEYGVAVGWDNMGDLDAADIIRVQVWPVERKNTNSQWTVSKLAEVMLIDEVPEITSRDYMLVLNRNAYDNDELLLNVVFEDGTAKEIQIDDINLAGVTFNNTNDFMKAYAYVENSDGTYDIVNVTRIGAADSYLLKVGTVDQKTTPNTYWALEDTANVWDVTGVESAGDAVEAGKFTTIDVNAVIVPTTVGGTIIRTAWIWDIEAAAPVVTHPCSENWAFDWTLTDYVDVYGSTIASTVVDNEIQKNLSAGDNVRVNSNLTLASNLYIPVGTILQVNGNLNTNGHTIIGGGMLRVAGNYTTNTGVGVPTQVGGWLNCAGNITADTHVYGMAYLSTTSVVEAGVHLCASNMTLNLVDSDNDSLLTDEMMVIYGHVDAVNVYAYAPIAVLSDTTLNLQGNLYLYNNGTTQLGNLIVGDGTAANAGAVVMTKGGDIVGDGSVSLRSGSITLGTGSVIDINGALAVAAGTTLTQASGNIEAGNVAISGTVSVPGYIYATDAAGTGLNVYNGAKLQNVTDLDSAIGTNVTIQPGVTMPAALATALGYNSASTTDTVIAGEATPGETPEQPDEPGETDTAVTAVTYTLSAPVAGEALPSAVGGDDTQYTVTTAWTVDGAAATGNAEAGKTYTATITVTAADGYKFTTETTVNNKSAGLTADSKTITKTQEFTVPTEGGGTGDTTGLPAAETVAGQTNKLNVPVYIGELDTSDKADLATIGSNVKAKVEADLKMNVLSVQVADGAATATIVTTDGTIYTATLEQFYKVTIDTKFVGYVNNDDTKTISGVNKGIYIAANSAGGVATVANTVAEDGKLTFSSVSGDQNLVSAVEVSITTTDLATPNPVVSKYTNANGVEQSVEVSATNKYVAVNTVLTITTGTLTANKYYQVMAGDTKVGKEYLGADGATDAFAVTYTVNADDVNSTSNKLEIKLASGVKVMLGDQTLGIYADNAKVVLDKSMGGKNFVVVGTSAHNSSPLTATKKVAYDDQDNVVETAEIANIGTISSSAVKGVVSLAIAQQVTLPSSNALSLTYTYGTGDAQIKETTGVTATTYVAEGAVLTVTSKSTPSSTTAGEYLTLAVGENGKAEKVGTEGNDLVAAKAEYTLGSDSVTFDLVKRLNTVTLGSMTITKDNAFSGSLSTATGLKGTGSFTWKSGELAESGNLKAGVAYVYTVTVEADTGYYVTTALRAAQGTNSTITVNPDYVQNSDGTVSFTISFTVAE